jgi:hypothetical protein
VTVTGFEILPDIERRIGANRADLDGEAKEVFVVEAYRQDRHTPEPARWWAASAPFGWQADGLTR